MSYYYDSYNPYNNLSLWDIIEALQNQASQADAAEEEATAAPRAAPTPRRQGPSPASARAAAAAAAAAARPVPTVRPVPAAARPAPAARPVPTAAPAPTPAAPAPTPAKPVSASPLVLKPVSRTDVFLPSIDVYDTPEAYRLYASVPGAQKASVEVHFNPDSHELTLEGEVPIPGPISGAAEGKIHLLLSERETGAFARTLHLPSEPKVDDEKITAKFNAGVLEITIPKKSGEKTARRKITIEDVDDEELLSEAQESVE
ncbi:uncharacterized protein SAPINGB_P005006 [Magnusiomyces paraingens]|uniref:SHSP domain-containing protein n=1 Tax=Magnusiomyces paraingens TaxID=2606893 RepID=A0A5E8BZ44_9ASCO|nr:uncharacterized protein SAPINGB_P005006 [Saprochaete ingens]VVT56362.1 unnamed protein product [Saprochaete ingens]